MEPGFLSYRWALYKNLQEAGKEEEAVETLEYILEMTFGNEDEYSLYIRQKAEDDKQVPRYHANQGQK